MDAEIGVVTIAAHRRRGIYRRSRRVGEAVTPCSLHPSDLSPAVPGQPSQYSTRPVPRCGFNRARDIVTESSKGSLAILFMTVTAARVRTLPWALAAAVSAGLAAVSFVHFREQPRGAEPVRFKRGT
jgi:hypothetical protein